MINPKKMHEFRKKQSEMQKELEQVFATEEKRGIKVVVRGDRKIERIEFDGEEQKDLKELINNAFKQVNKKSEKKIRGAVSDLGIPGL